MTGASSLSSRESVEIDLLPPRGLNFDVSACAASSATCLSTCAHVRAAVVHAAERVADRALGRDHRHDLELHPPLQVVDREHVRRVRHRHEKLAIQARYRRQLVRLRHFARHQFMISSGTRTFERLIGAVFRQRPMLKAMS